MEHFTTRVQINRDHVYSSLLAIDIVEASNVQISEGLDRVSSVPREKPFAEMKTCEGTSLALRLSTFNKGSDLLDAAGPTQKLNQLRECVKVIRFFFKQHAVGANGFLSFFIDKHQVSIHERSLFI